MFKRRYVLAFVLMLTLVFSGVALAVDPPVNGDASEPISNGGVTPYIIPDNSGNMSGFRTCADVGREFFGDEGYYQYERISNWDDDDGWDNLPAGVTANRYGTPPNNVDWSSTFPIGAVFIRGGNDTNVYVYDPQSMGDTGLGTPPQGAGGNRPAANELGICWNPVVVSQWCSPGYWRQTQHLHSWAATGYSPGDLFYDALGYYPTRSTKGVSDGATTNPTLWQVLQKPQWYGGDDFNAVGDLLSEAHPDVNFTGERVENSCPLN